MEEREKDLPHIFWLALFVGFLLVLWEMRRERRQQRREEKRVGDEAIAAAKKIISTKSQL